jgi:hypothetical protein
MAKMTLLEIVQDILNDLDSDKVNSIDDTVESDQITQIVKTCYFEIMGNRNWPHLKKLTQIDALSDLTKPNYLKLPDNLKELVTFRYEVQKVSETKIDLREIKFKENESFLRYISQRNSDNDNVVEVEDFSGTKLLVLNDQAPSYWTSFDDTYIVTDAYDSTVDDTLKKSKSQCIAYFMPTWTASDSFVPDLPVDAFPLLLAESKSTAFFVLKQMTNQKAEQKAGRQNRWLSRKAWRAEGSIRYPDYGRKSRI